MIGRPVDRGPGGVGFRTTSMELVGCGASDNNVLDSALTC